MSERTRRIRKTARLLEEAAGEGAAFVEIINRHAKRGELHATIQKSRSCLGAVALLLINLALPLLLKG